jgi:tetratricopeptide (TPR) repeat protein
MKDITEFRWNVRIFFEMLSVYIISGLAGYPDHALNKSFYREMAFLDQRMLQVLIAEDFEVNHSLLILVNELKGYLEDFDRTDARMGEWLLKKNRISTKELWKRWHVEIHFGIFDEMVKKGAIYPDWLEEPAYQEYLQQAILIIEKILNIFEAIENQILVLRTIKKNEAVILSFESRIRQKTKFFRWIMQKGIRQAFPEILTAIQTEKDPLGWLTEGFNQRIDDMIDESAALSAINPKAAIRVLEKAFQLKPKTSQACQLYFSLAMNYEELEKWEEAIDAYSKMLEVAPPNGVGLFYRARIFHQLGRDAEAKRDLEQALSLPPLHIYVLDEKQTIEAKKLLFELSIKE